MRGFNFIFYDISMRCGTYFIIQISQNRSRNMEQVVLEMEMELKRNVSSM